MSLGPYRVGDNPAAPVSIFVDLDEDLTAYTHATITVLDALGATAAVIGPVPFDGTQITFTFPTGTFSSSGTYSAAPVLTGGGVLSLDRVAVVVEADDGWHTLASARETWVGAPVDDVQLSSVLDSAKVQCIRFAPSRAGTVPANYRLAQIMQARALWNSGHVNQNDQFGGGDMTVTVFPMDWTVKSLLRPKAAVGGMF